MRIKQINIDRYGPLNQVFLLINEGIQPIYGDNESGKTLLVDALIKQLTGNKISDSSLNRVTETPEGYIILEDEGKEYKIDRDNDLSGYLLLESDEIRNIFVIRNSDLKIPKEDRFYERTYQRLMGLRTDDIRKIIDKIKDMGRLTKTTLDLADSVKYDKAASNLASAERLHRQIDPYLEDTSQKGIDQTESELYEDKLKKEELFKQLGVLDKAKKKENYLELESTLDELKHTNEALKELPENDEIVRINLKIEEYLKNETELPKIARISNGLKNAFYLLSVCTFVSWALGDMQNASLSGFIIPLLFAAGAIISGYIWYINSRQKSGIEAEKNEIVRLSNRLGIDQETIGDIQKRLNVLKKNISKYYDKVQQHLGVLRTNLNIIEEDAKSVIENAEQSLSDRKNEIDFEVVTEYDLKLYGQHEEDLQQLDEKIRAKEERLSDHNSKLSEFSKTASEIDFNTFIGRPLNLIVNNLESLKLLKNELSTFSEKIKSDVSSAVSAAEIFQELEREESDKIADLFTEDNETSKLFSRMTKGRYSKVFYENSENKIYVERPSGQKLEALKLSKGAYDQLYLAIRIDLAQRIMEGRGAFMILDDAFLTSGATRFKEGIEIMRELAEQGWNFLYLTVKEVDADKIKQASGNELITLPPFP